MSRAHASVAPAGRPAARDTDATRHIAYYLRHPGNLHYFASLQPYLDRLRRNPNYRHYLVVDDGLAQVASEREYDGYRALFTQDAALDRYDLVVTPTYLRPHERSARMKAVQVFHGMSDKPFTYDRNFRDYLLCLCAGQRQVDRLRANPENRDVNCVLVGYPKFNSYPRVAKLFRNQKRTLVYCPTWRKEGISSIERFLDRPATIERLADRYNLVVKPHPNIFNAARDHYDAGLVDKLEQVARLGDVSLVRSGNAMSWFAQSDLFIGDISASGYEWLHFGRPMVFLNPKPGTLRPTTDVTGMTYLWQCGPVCDAVESLPAAIDAAFAADGFAAVRERILQYSVHRPRQNGAAARGAAEIEKLLS